MITSHIQNTHLNSNCVQPPVTGKQFQCFDFNVYKHENVNMVIISWQHYITDLFCFRAKSIPKLNSVQKLCGTGFSQFLLLYVILGPTSL